jgi:hypothetical protein
MTDPDQSYKLAAGMRRRRGDLVIGIALGIALGLAIVAVFVFLFSEDTVDAPSIDEGTSTENPAEP